LISDVGYANLYPEVFGTRKGTTIANLMDVARGGYFEVAPDNYPARAWYTNPTKGCRYGCMVGEYFHWGMTSVLGVHVNRGDHIRHEWKLFYQQKNTLPLVRALRQRMTSANKTNCILTFSSEQVMSPEHIRVCAPSIQICYLYGSAAHCINAFLRRELETGRRLDINYWNLNNRDSYTKMSVPSLEPYRVHVFTSEGQHRSHADIWVEVSNTTMHN